jgi:hypothetical protein
MATAATMPAVSASHRSAFPRWVAKHFYFVMSLLIAAIVVYAFSHTVGDRLIHAVPRRPVLLWVHGIVFSAWVAFYILQSALVRLRKVALHRTVGWIGAALGVAVILVGFRVPVVMAQFAITYLHREAGAAHAFLAIPFLDMVTFTTCFALAVLWRTKPELHRRLMLIATCALTAAAFGRMGMIRSIPPLGFYFGVDALILLGAVRDLVVNRRIHTVYLTTVPLLVPAQAAAVYIAEHQSAFWLRIMDKLIS